METNQQVQDNSTYSSVRMITAMFADRNNADSAYKRLIERGYSKEEISLIMSAETQKKYYPEDVDAKETGATTALGEAAVGSAIGGTLGAIIGVVAAVSTNLVVPGLGFIIAGPIIAGIAGAGAGVVTGGLIGALSGAGIPADHAQLYEAGINKGYIVLGVHPRSTEDADYFEQKWKEDKASDIYR